MFFLWRYPRFGGRHRSVERGLERAFGAALLSTALKMIFAAQGCGGLVNPITAIRE